MQPTDHRGTPVGGNHNPLPRGTVECRDCGDVVRKSDAEEYRSSNPVTAEPGTGPKFHVCQNCHNDRVSVAETDERAFRQIARGY